MGAIAATATRTLQGFEPQNISNVVWSFATAGIPAPDLFRAVAATLVEDSRRNTPRWRRMTAQVMANIVWAYATANNDPGPELFEVLGAAAMGCLRTFDPQNLANFAWAYATVERASPQLFGALAQASLHRLDDFVAEGLSSTAWAYAKAGIPAPTLFREIAKRAQAKLGSFNHQALYVIRVPLPRLVDATPSTRISHTTAWRVSSPIPTPSTRRRPVTASPRWRVPHLTHDAIDLSNTQGQRRLGLRRGRRPRARAFRRHRRDGLNTRRALQLPGPREPGPGLLERT